MKKFLFAIFLLINLTNSSFSNEKTFFIDLEKILNETKSGKLVINELNKINNKNLEILKVKEEEIKTDEDEINKVKNLINQDELENKMKDLRIKISQYNEVRNKMITDFNTYRENKFNDFFNSINPLIQNFMLENDIAILIDKKNIFIGSKKNDITANVINLINSKL